MSSPVSDVTRLELPRVLLAEKLGLGLCLASGLLLEFLGLRYRGFPPGAGLALAGTLILLQLAQLARVRVIEWDSRGRFRVQFRDGRSSDARVGDGTRLLGSSVRLDLALPRLRPLQLWLLPAELGPEDRRSLALGLSRALTDRTAVRRLA
jgi:hypothetical protein